jgi:CheY-like chemotaxis protein
MPSGELTIFDFNLTTLVKLSDLNLRTVAKENKLLTIGMYFRTLSEFLGHVSDLSDAINRFADDDSYTMDWKTIKDIIPLFREMRCDKYIPDLDAIKNACERGDHRLAASHANKILDIGFNNFYSQLMSAKLTKGAASSLNANATVISCIKELDEKETDHKLMVLAVDDSPAILESVSAVLNSQYSVYKLPKPMMLESVLKQVKPHLFLLDYQMPERNGFELIPIIRGYIEHKFTPIIFLTSEGTMDNITAAVGLGACDFIVKPFNPDQLKEKVAKHIAR